MAVIKQGILGGVQNKIGSVVGSSWKGIAVLKAKPLSVANPRTASQMANRGRFASCAKWFSEINAEVIKPLWDRFAVRQSGYNAAVQYNIEAFNGDGTLVPADIFISNGKMGQTATSLVVADRSANSITVDWVDDSGEGLKLISDLAYVVAYNNDQPSFVVSAGLVSRGDTQAELSMPAGWTVGDDVYVYLAFRRTDGTVVSVSTYTLATIVA